MSTKIVSSKAKLANQKKIDEEKEKEKIIIESDDEDEEETVPVKSPVKIISSRKNIPKKKIIIPIKEESEDEDEDIIPLPTKSETVKKPSTIVISKKISNKIISDTGTRVVSIKGQAGQVLTENQVYVGRKFNMGNWKLPESVFANKYKGETAVVNYYNWLLEPEQAELREQAKEELIGKDIACWCVETKAPSSRSSKTKKVEEPIQCHGYALQCVVEGVMNPGLQYSLDKYAKLTDSTTKNKLEFTEMINEIEPQSIEDRILGMLYASMMGDAIGSLFEFGSKHPDYTDRITERLTVSNARFKTEPYSYGLGQVTDDTEMMLCLAEELTL